MGSKRLISGNSSSAELWVRVFQKTKIARFSPLPPLSVVHVGALVVCFNKLGSGTKFALCERDCVHIMTCRIERVVGPDGIVVLQISGRIDGPDIEILRELMESETPSKSTVALDLRNVTLISRDAIKLLSTVEEKGTELRNCPAYIREWVSREKHSRTMET